MQSFRQTFIVNLPLIIIIINNFNYLKSKLAMKLLCWCFVQKVCKQQIVCADYYYKLI